MQWIRHGECISEKIIYNFSLKTCKKKKNICDTDVGMRIIFKRTLKYGVTADWTELAQDGVQRNFVYNVRREISDR